MPDTPVKPNLDFLHKQVGPLPVGGWLIVVGAGLAFSYWRKRQAPTASNTSDQIQPQFTDETVGNVFALMGALNRGQSGVPTQAIGDNNTWYQSAVRELLGHGFVPGLVDTALRKYMQGMSLSVEENAVIERALQLVGPLPSPPPPPTTTPTTPVQPTNNPLIKSLATYKVNPTLTPASVQHLSDVDLVSASNITSPSWNLDPNWQTVVAMQYGTDDPLAYMNEIARRYQAGTLPDSILTGPVGSWTSGQPAWKLTWNDLTSRLTQIESRQPGRIQWT